MNHWEFETRDLIFTVMCAVVLLGVLAFAWQAGW